MDNNTQGGPVTEQHRRTYTARFLLPIAALGLMWFAGCVTTGRLPDPDNVGTVRVKLGVTDGMKAHMDRAYRNKKRLLRQMIKGNDTTSADYDRAAAELEKQNCNVLGVALAVPTSTGQPAPVLDQDVNESSASMKGVTCPEPQVKCFADLSFSNVAAGKYAIIVTVKCSDRVCAYFLDKNMALTNNPGLASLFVIDPAVPLDLTITVTENEACTN